MTDLHHRFEGRQAVVCGAASGIGAAVVRRLRAEGAGVAAIGVPFDLLQSHALAHGAHAFECDVTQDDAVRRAVAQATEVLGRIDVLVNAAGIVINDDAASIDDDTWHRTHDVNLGGTMRVMRAVLPCMVRQGSGSVVNVASVAAFNASAGMASYAASKAGVGGTHPRRGAGLWATSACASMRSAPGWVDTSR